MSIDKKEINRLKQQSFERRMKDENRRKASLYLRLEDIEKAVELYRKTTGTNKINIRREAITTLFESALNQQPLTLPTGQDNVAIERVEHQLKSALVEKEQAETQRDIAKANADKCYQQLETYKAKVKNKRQELEGKKLDSPRWEKLADFISELEEI